jgi:hypothetical protein
MRQEATVAFVVPPPGCFIPLRRRLLLSVEMRRCVVRMADRVRARIAADHWNMFALFCLRKNRSRSGMPTLIARAGPAPGETRE